MGRLRESVSDSLNDYAASVYVKYITYTGRRYLYHPDKSKEKSISVIGIDTEADVYGRCFMIATSLGDVFRWEDFPACMFSRRYRNKTFVAYNLKYDSGHFISWLPQENIRELWEKDSTKYECYKVKTIRYKMLRITRNKKDSITFYDMYNFYQGAGVKGSSSLDSVAENILGERKVDIETKKFRCKYIRDNWDKIGKYCIQDAVLVERLGNKIIKQFEEWGIKPRALYSTAYVSYQYFYTHTNYVTVRRFWDKHRMLLDYALQSYNGGKFEVTRKGRDYYYEYDIVSAYPYEIANLIDISTARVVYNEKYEPEAVYSFLKCLIEIPIDVYSPIALKWGAANIFPVGRVVKVITKNEYEYMLSVGCTIHIVDAYHMFTHSKIKPYRDEVLKLFEYKKQYKRSNNKLLYHTIKILLNSLCGKFTQKIPTDTGWKCSTCWNPIYAAVITANTRIMVSRMQQLYPSVVAVHTDSVITTKKIDIPISKELGAWDFDAEGEGIIIGSGVYQVGDKSKYRGFHTSTPLLELTKIKRSRRRMYGSKSLTWREVAFHGWDKEKINLFTTDDKWFNVRFDKKRLWINDYKTFAQAHRRFCFSLPYVVDLFDSPPD